MPTLKDILGVKGSRVHTITGAMTVLQAARIMNDNKIGCLVVCEEEGEVAGIFTERDVLSRVVAEQRDPAATHVGDVMTTHVVCGQMETSIDEARTVFKRRRIRHMPVVDSERKLLGLISIGDLNAYQADTQEQTILFMKEYIYGRV